MARNAARIFRLWSPWWKTARDVRISLEAILGGGNGGLARLAWVLASTLCAWFVYVPIHEFMHAFGCLAAGGAVQELQIHELYGGRLLEAHVPFVRAAAGHAGRLTKFDTGGSDVVYL